jgi:hypothetical protein
MPDTNELRTKLEAGLATLINDRDQIDGQISAVRKALEALDGKPAQFAKASHRSSPEAMQKLAGPPAPVEVMPAGKLVGVLKGSDGLSTRELAKNTNGDPAQLLELLKELEAGGQVHRTGSKAATRWHAGSAPDES